MDQVEVIKMAAGKLIDIRDPNAFLVYCRGLYFSGHAMS